MTGDFNSAEKLVRACWPWFIKKNGKVTSAAFKPRLMEDGKFEGISVDRTHTRTLDETVKDMIPHFSSRSRFAHVTVLSCQEIGVYIKYIPGKNTKYHSEIYSQAPDIPLTAEESKKLADAAVLYVADSESE